MKYSSLILVLVLLVAANLATAEGNNFASTYAKAEEFLKAKKYGEFSDLTADLIKFREDEGYANFVPLSERLIEAGRVACQTQDSNCSFYVKTATLLSPSDPWTFFAASTVTQSTKESVGYFFNSLKLAKNSPTFFFKGCIVSGISLLALFSLYISLKLLFRIVRFEMKKLSPKGILTYSVLALGGLPFGIIPTALCWSMILLLFTGRRREVIQLLLLTLLWISFLPTAENMVRFVSRPEEREYELLLSKIASPSLFAKAPVYLSEPAYLGTRYFREGQFELAAAQFSLSKNGNDETSKASISRLAATQLSLKKFDEAKSNIAMAKATGLNSYELVHNEANLAAATANLGESRILLDKLKEIDKNRFSKASLSTGVLLEPLPLGTFSDRYLEPMEKHLHALPPPVQWISSEKMLSPLCSMGLAGLLVLSAIMALLLIAPTNKLRSLI